MRSKNFSDSKPLLYLVATPIGNLSDFSPRALEIIKDADLIASEDTRVAGKLLSFFNIKKSMYSLHEHNEVEASLKVIDRIKAGEKVVYMSDAGYPAISDPGARLVDLALNNDINVSVIPGPSAFLSALVCSGLDSSHFYFHGFLSAKDGERRKELEELKVRKETIIFYEAPHRIEKVLKDLLNVLGNRRICIARELTKLHEEYIRINLEEIKDLDFETIKGECVVVVEGNKEEIKLSDEEIISLVEQEEKKGVSSKDAIKIVSELTKVNKNYIYKIYHRK